MSDRGNFEDSGSKSSRDQEAVSGSIESGKGPGKAAFEIGADRVGEGEKEKEIAEKSKSRDNLRKTWQSKMEDFKAMRKEHEAHLETLKRLNSSGKLSAESLKAELDSMDEKEKAASRDMKGYYDDAEELDEEIRSLKSPGDRPN